MTTTVDKTSTGPQQDSSYNKIAKKKTKREPNRWMKHLSAWRKSHADLVKTMKVGEVAKAARKDYVKAEPSV